MESNESTLEKFKARKLNAVSVSDALKRIPVNREAFYRKLKRGELPSFRFGRKVLVDVEEVLEAMRSKKD